MSPTDETDFFMANGYLGPVTLCTPGEMAAIKGNHLDPLIDGSAEEETIASQVNPSKGHAKPLLTVYDRHLTHAAVFGLVAHPEIVKWAEILLARDILLWRSTFWIKQPGGRRLEWHQDTYKTEGFGSFPNLNAWIAVDEATVDNAVQLIPGSHRQIIPRETFADPAYVAGLTRDEALPPPPVPHDRIVTMALQPGQCFLFDGRVLHGSHPNLGDRRRAGLVGRFIPATTHLAGLASPCIAVAGDPAATKHRLAPIPAA